jgi:antitoxin (DNA-binding transcriptional repressor) of toxin-antitoxin stability system
MNASLVDLRRKTRKITEAIEQRQEVTLSKRGKRIATIVPYPQLTDDKPGAVAGHSAVGMWADHEDTSDVAATIRKLRQSRFDAL